MSYTLVWQDLLFCVSKNLKNCSENDATNKSNISDEGGVFEYRAPKDQNKNHDESPIRLETPGSNVVITLVGVNHIRTYAHGTSYILKLGDFYGHSSQYLLVKGQYFLVRLSEWAEKIELEILVIVSSQTLSPSPVPAAGKPGSARSRSGSLDLNADPCSRVLLSN